MMKKIIIAALLSNVGWMIRYYRVTGVLPEWTVLVSFTLSFIATVMFMEVIILWTLKTLKKK
jgi:hypothetical protein